MARRRGPSLRGLLLAALIGAGACASSPLPAAPGPLDQPEVERVGPEAVRIRWTSSFSTEGVAIYVGLSPEAIQRQRPLAVARGSSVTLVASDRFPYLRDDRRLYYEIVPLPDGEPVLAAERLLPLEGPDNFRDLGGYPTLDGRRVRWGRLFRSNQLSGLTRSDLEYLSRLKLRLICDFRSDREQSRHPDVELPTRAPATLDLPVDSEGLDPIAMQERIRTGGVTELGVHDTMLAAYRSFVTDYSARWAAMFRRLADPASLPALVHCTAGKDRTGFASALVLLALGVPEQTVFQDYLLTNRYRADFSRFVLRWTPLYSFFRTRPDDLLPLLEARPEYLQLSLETIRAQHGSIDTYLENELGVTPSLRAALEANLLD